MLVGPSLVAPTSGVAICRLYWGVDANRGFLFQRALADTAGFWGGIVGGTTVGPTHYLCFRGSRCSGGSGEDLGFWSPRGSSGAPVRCDLRNPTLLRTGACEQLRGDPQKNCSRGVSVVAWRQRGRVASARSRGVGAVAWRRRGCVASAWLRGVGVVAWRQGSASQVSISEREAAPTAEWRTLPVLSM